MVGECAVTIINRAFEHTTASRSLSVWHCEIDIVCGLVNEVVNTREPSLAKIMRDTLKPDTHIADVSAAVPKHSAPTVIKGVSTI